MAFIFTQEQVDRLTPIIQAALVSFGENNDASGIFTEAYEAIFEEISDITGGQNRNFIPKSGVDPSVWAWIAGAQDVNSGVGGFAGFIRTYTEHQHEAREGVSMVPGEIQYASNSVAANFFTDVLSKLQDTKELPTIREIGEADAGDAFPFLFHFSNRNGQQDSTNFDIRSDTSCVGRSYSTEKIGIIACGIWDVLTARALGKRVANRTQFDWVFRLSAAIPTFLIFLSFACFPAFAESEDVGVLLNHPTKGLKDIASIPYRIDGQLLDDLGNRLTATELVEYRAAVTRYPNLLECLNQAQYQSEPIVTKSIAIADFANSFDLEVCIFRLSDFLRNPTLLEAWLVDQGFHSSIRFVVPFSRFRLLGGDDDGIAVSATWSTDSDTFPFAEGTRLQILGEAAYSFSITILMKKDGEPVSVDSGFSYK